MSVNFKKKLKTRIYNMNCASKVASEVCDLEDIENAEFYQVFCTRRKTTCKDEHRSSYEHIEIMTTELTQLHLARSVCVCEKIQLSLFQKKQKMNGDIKSWKCFCENNATKATSFSSCFLPKKHKCFLGA